MFIWFENSVVGRNEYIFSTHIILKTVMYQLHKYSTVVNTQYVDYYWHIYTDTSESMW